MATLRELKGRIASVASSEKITGAMKMISSAKMHKAEGELRRLVPFRCQIEGILANLLSSDATFQSPLVNTRPKMRAMVLVVWGSDDGLCGAYNVNIYKQLLLHIADLRQQIGADPVIEIIPVGKKMAAATARINLRNVKVIPAPEGIDSKTDGTRVVEFMQMLQQHFEKGQYDRLDTLYMNFISAGRQRPVHKQLLPLQAANFETCSTAICAVKPYLFEPDAQSIFNTVVPMLLMAAMQDIFTQNRASEQAARIMAMQAANDNAKKLLEQLQLDYNKLRQQSITNELLDIVGGQVKG